MNNGMETIRARRSVRTFDGKALPQEEKEQLLACARSMENPYGIAIEWRILDAKEKKLSSPVIKGTDTFIAGKMKREPHAEEAFGYSFEGFVLAAQEAGIGTTWIAGTMDRAAFERAMELKEGEVMPCVSPLGRPADRMSMRETMMRAGIKADTRMEPIEVFYDGIWGVPTDPNKDPLLTEALEAVRWAPSAVNRQPWRTVTVGDRVHFYEKRTKGYVDASGWDLQKVDMGIALYHFAYTAEKQGRAAELIVEDPGLGVPEDVFYTATFVLK